MDKYSNLVADGILCSECGTGMGSASGKPRKCTQCLKPYPKSTKNNKRIKCTRCFRLIKRSSMAQHNRDMHGK